MALVTAKCATIFVASGDTTKVYRSVEDVPQDLRRKLIETTHSANSATILIADKRGREELIRALRGKRTDIRSRLVDTLRAKQPENPTVSRHASYQSPRIWLEFLLPVAIAASLWLLFDWRP